MERTTPRVISLDHQLFNDSSLSILHLQIIQRSYKTMFGKDLIEDIRSETSGNFENLLVALITPIVDFYVKELHDAMAGLGTDEDVLIEVLCSMSNYEIHTIKNAYVRMYGQNLESELMSETSGNFKRLLVSLCAANRDESGVVDPVAAKRDATELLRAGELRAGTDESTFNMVFCQRNYAQIKLVSSLKVSLDSPISRNSNEQKLISRCRFVKNTNI